MQQRKQKVGTVPSTIEDELEFNPVMQVDLKPLQLAALIKYLIHQ